MIKNKFNERIVILLILLSFLLLTGCNQNNPKSKSKEESLIKKADVTFINTSYNFTNLSNDWATGFGDNSIYRYIDQKYEIRGMSAGRTYWSYAPVHKLAPQYTIETDVMLSEGKSGEYGFLFNYVSRDNFYVFKINPTKKYFTVKRYYQGQWYEIINKIKNSKSIHNKKNHLKLVQDKAKLKLYINGTKVAEKEIGKYLYQVRVGLLVSTSNNKENIPLAVQFDNFQLAGYVIK